MIDFKGMDYQAFEHFKGGDGALDAKMFFDGTNRMLMGRLPVGSSIGMHTHDTSSEMILILSGVGHFIMDGEEEFVQPGQVHYCPKGHTHTFISDGDEEVTFFAVVPEQ